MGILSERLHIGKANRQDRALRYDNVSTVPVKILEDVERQTGLNATIISSDIYQRRTHGLNTPEHMKVAIMGEVFQRVLTNITLLPEPLHTDEVAAVVTAFVIHNNRLYGETELIIRTDASPFPFDNDKKRECARIMRETGLIEVFSHRTRKGNESEVWMLSKNIDPLLGENE